jgi:hypothetical protein
VLVVFDRPQGAATIGATKLMSAFGVGCVKETVLVFLLWIFDLEIQDEFSELP